MLRRRVFEQARFLHAHQRQHAVVVFQIQIDRRNARVGVEHNVHADGRARRRFRAAERNGAACFGCARHVGRQAVKALDAVDAARQNHSVLGVHPAVAVDVCKRFVDFCFAVPHARHIARNQGGVRGVHHAVVIHVAEQRLLARIADGDSELGGSAAVARCCHGRDALAAGGDPARCSVHRGDALVGGGVGVGVKGVSRVGCQGGAVGVADRQRHLVLRERNGLRRLIVCNVVRLDAGAPEIDRCFAARKQVLCQTHHHAVLLDINARSCGIDNAVARRRDADF